MKRFVVILSVVLANALVQSTRVSQCTANPGQLPIRTSIDGCGTPPCILYQREYTDINIAFIAPYNISSMTTLATAYMSLGMLKIPIPYNLREQADTCRFLIGTQCPVSQGRRVNYTLKMYIKPFFPAGTNADIEFRVVDQYMKPVFCFRTSIRIGAARKGRRDAWPLRN